MPRNYRRGFTRLSSPPYTFRLAEMLEWAMGELMIRCPKTGKPFQRAYTSGARNSARCQSSSAVPFARRAALRMNGLPGMHGSATRTLGPVTRIAAGGPLSARRQASQGIRGGLLARATKPRPPPERTTDSHNHIKVVAVFEWRLDNHHAACRAHGVRVGSTGATNVCQHRRSADCTLFETPPAILILRVRSHGTRLPK